MIESFLLSLNQRLNLALLKSRRTKNPVYVGVCFGNWEGKHPDKPRMNWYVGTEPQDICGICGQSFEIQKIIGGQEWNQTLEQLYSEPTPSGTNDNRDSPSTAQSAESP